MIYIIREAPALHCGDLVKCGCCGTYFPATEPHTAAEDATATCELCLEQMAQPQPQEAA